MPKSDQLPLDHKAQQAVERVWLTTVQANRPAVGVRSTVQASWERSLTAEVKPDLPAAPVVWDDDQLSSKVEQNLWLGLARQAVTVHQASFSGVGHILTLFDHQARMLAAEGDPAALEGLGEINFRPGGHWSEEVVGTNGPGTALATGMPTHIVGAEHFCERWHRWHCAAVPVRDPSTGEILGVLDISGFREYAHPHTLNLALALVVAIERGLAARDTEWRYLALSRFTELTLHYPGDPLLAVDRAGRVLCASPTVPEVLRRDTHGLQNRVAQLMTGTRDTAPQEIQVSIAGRDQRGVWYPVFDGSRVVGGCLGLERLALEPLEDRSGGLVVMARGLFQSAARDLGLNAVKVDEQVFQAFARYHWPGNLREMKHLIRRLVAASPAEIRVADLPQSMRPNRPGASTIDQEDARLMEVVNRSETMADAAAALGITRSTLYRRMARYGLKPKRVVDRA